MSLDLVPKRNNRISLYCTACVKKQDHVITGIKKNSINDDGSTCFTLKGTCQVCGYFKGVYKPIWYNLYQAGDIVD